MMAETFGYRTVEEENGVSVPEVRCIFLNDPSHIRFFMCFFFFKESSFIILSEHIK